MDRLTMRDEFNNADVVGVDSEKLQDGLTFKEFNCMTKALNKLAEYEETRVSIQNIRELPEVIARNLVAWDTSKDNKEGLLPEVYLTNKHIYKQLTGIEYSLSDAIRRFGIGN